MGSEMCIRDRGVDGIAFTPPNAEILYDTADQTATVVLDPVEEATAYVQIEFGISGGTLYHPETPDSNNFKTTTTTSLTRFTDDISQATVKFKPRSSSNVQITARVVLKRELEAVKTFYYRDAVLDKVSGDDQTGRPNTQLTPVSYTHLRAHETVLDLVCRLLLEKKKDRRDFA